MNTEADSVSRTQINDESPSAIITAIRETKGFNELPVEDKDLIIKFASAYFDFFNDPENDSKKDAFLGFYHDILGTRREHLREIAYRASFGALAGFRKSNNCEQ